MEEGIRVVRGPDWKWGDQDGGEGHAGTVIKIGETIDKEQTVFVKWDCGNEIKTGGTVGNYRISDIHDLRIIDSSTAGIIFPTITCDECHTTCIRGTRWKCEQCHNYDLCDRCYMSDKHLLSHSFLRYDLTRESGVKVGAREKSRKCELYGIYAEAVVLRDVSDWLQSGQDGGMCSLGTVVAGEEEPGKVRVKWYDGPTLEHHRGQNGKVDVWTISPSMGGSYYVDHLALLDKSCLPGAAPRRNCKSGGKRAETCESDDAEESNCIRDSEDTGDSGSDSDADDDFVDDEVSSGSDDDDDDDDAADDDDDDGEWRGVFERRDDGTGSGRAEGLNDHLRRLAEQLERLEVGSSGVLSLVQGGGRMGEHGTIVQGEVHKGDRLLIDPSLNEESFKSLQEEPNTGGWNRDMANYVGRVGNVLRVQNGGPVRLEFKIGSASKEWTVNPKCLKSKMFVVGDRLCVSDDEQGVKERQRKHGGWVDSMRQMLGEVFTVSSVEPDGSGLLVQFKDGCDIELNAWSCSLETSFETACQEEINNESCGVEDVRRRLDEGLNPRDPVDQTGNNFAHSLVLNGDNVDALTLVLDRFPDVGELVNFELCSLLHCAVKKRRFHCARALVLRQLNLNSKDLAGDTPLHDALQTCSSLQRDSFVELLTEPSIFDYRVVNERGLNVLQLAAAKDNVLAVKRIIARDRHLLDQSEKTSLPGLKDISSPLHIACVSGSINAVRAIIEFDRTYLERLCVKSGHSPLLTAVVHKEAAVAEYLVLSGANVNAADSDGDTCIHNIIMFLIGTQNLSVPMCNIDQATQLKQIHDELPSDTCNKSWIAMICFLVKHGADLDQANMKSTSSRVLAQVYDRGLPQLMHRYAHRPLSLKTPTSLFRVSVESTSSKSESLTMQENKTGSNRLKMNLRAVGVVNETSGASVEEVQNCLKCFEEMACVTVLPCGHKVYCLECSRADGNRKCLECMEVIADTRIDMSVLRLSKLSARAQ